MLSGVMFLGLLAAFGLSSFGETDDGDEAGGKAGADGDEPGEPAGQEYIAGGVPGTTVISEFTPGADSLLLRIPGDTAALDLTDGDGTGGATISYVSADDVIALRFEGLDSVPVDDIAVLLDGDGDPIPLGAFLDMADEDDGEDTALPPDDPDQPSDEGEPGDGGVLPGDPDQPSDPGDPDQPGDVVLTPGDPAQPAGADGSPDLDALMMRDGADPTGQTDQPAEVTATGAGDDLVTLDDDGQDGTGAGGVLLSEAAALTGGIVVDLGEGDDTLVAGDGAVAAFGGDGDDMLAAGDGGAALYGGAGNDVLTGDAGTGATDLLHGGAGDDTLTGGDGGDYLDGGEHAEAPGAAGDDSISGGGGDDTIRGGWGADSLSGGDGDDVIDHRGTDETRIVEEEWHHDWYADGAADTLDGGAGDDTLTFASGDTATGGSGADLFWVYPEAAGADPAIITDFVPGEDFLRITLDTQMAGEVTVVPSEDGVDSLVLVGGQVVAVLSGTPDATTADLYVEVRPEVFP